LSSSATKEQQKNKIDRLFGDSVLSSVSSSLLYSIGYVLHIGT